MNELWDIQKQFTSKVINRLDKPLSDFTDDDRVRWTKEYVLTIIDECMSLLDQLDWKRHHVKAIKDINIGNIMIEGIDIQKFLWGMLQIWGISYEDYVKCFHDKSYEVEKKWAQEFELEGIDKRNDIAIIDIDGVLNYYPDCLYDWIKSNYNVNKEDYIDNPVQYKRYKDLYRRSGIKRQLVANKSSIAGLKKLKKKGYTIVLLTNRPYKEYQNIVSDTLHWLEENKIPYDYIYWSDEDKPLSILDKTKNIRFVIDDREDTCLRFERFGVKTYLYNKKIKSIGEIEELQNGN